jgi:hypothetical protein
VRRRGAAPPPAPATAGLGDRHARLVSIILPVTTFAVLCQEIVLTRLFAYIFTYHLTALAVSFAVFGLGAGAYARVRWLPALPQRTLAVVAHLASSASLLALYVALMLTHEMVVIVVLSAVPFLSAGVAVSHYYEVRRAERAATTYALDLSGAAAACVAAVLLLTALGADGALLALATLTGAAAALAAMRADTMLRRPFLILAALCCVLPGLTYGFRDHWPDPMLNRHSSADKQLPRLLREHGGEVIDWAWSPVGRADLYQRPSDPDKLILADATNSTIFLAASPEGLPALFAFLPYAVAPVRAALVLGSGAGLEVRLAREAGVADVEAVELNAAIIRLVRRWRQFGGPVYDQPGVRLFIEEGRKFVLTRPRRYDLIQMSLVLTASAQSGTYALAESYLYTTEAFGSYLDHLEPTGALALIDDSFERTIKNTVTAVSVLQRRLDVGSAEAMRHVAVIFNRREGESGYKYLLMVGAAPLSAERIRRLADEGRARPLAFLWVPGLAATPRFQALATDGVDAFVGAAPINLTPPTDDRPYLNNFAKTTGQVLELLRPYLVLSAAMLAALVAALVTSGAFPRRATALAGVYGVAFMFLELGLLHKLTLAAGGPTYTLSILLFGLLLYCGLGSLVSARVAPAFRSRLGSFAIVVAVVGAATAEAIERWYRLEGVTSSALRALSVLAILAPIGLSLGAPFPDLLRRYGEADDRRLAYLWAVNGIGSVLGAGLTLVLSPLIGAHLVLLTGSALYLLAWTVDR